MILNILNKKKTYKLSESISLGLEDVEITSADMPGYIVSSHEGLTVALDITISEKLKEEGLAREFVNRIQNLRKTLCLEVTDKISISVLKNESIDSAIKNNLSYICDETLTKKLDFINSASKEFVKLELVDSIFASVLIKN